MPYRLRLSACLSRNAVTAPLLSGEVVPEGIEWAISGIHPSEMFWRQLTFGDFDVSEMSLSSLSIAASRGRRDWIAIPVFTTRKFFHTGIVVRSDADISSPADLVGARVGVPEYQQTAAVWARGALLHEFGVAPEQLAWFMERPPERSHGGSTGFVPPAGLDFSYIPTQKSIGSMLAVGELDAAIVYIADRNLVDRTAPEAQPRLRRLFPDPVAEGVRYFRATGLLPVNHTVVVRAEVLAQHPWLALNLYSAFVEAKRRAWSVLFPDPTPDLRSSAGLLEPWIQIGTVPESVSSAMTKTDPLPYGVASQPRVFETLFSYLAEQLLTSARLGADDLFAPTTLTL